MALRLTACGRMFRGPPGRSPSSRPRWRTSSWLSTVSSLDDQIPIVLVVVVLVAQNRSFENSLPLRGSSCGPCWCRRVVASIGQLAPLAARLRQPGLRAYESKMLLCMCGEYAQKVVSTRTSPTTSTCTSSQRGTAPLRGPRLLLLPEASAYFLCGSSPTLLDYLLCCSLSTLTPHARLRAAPGVCTVSYFF
jgi:hypothetical protein